LESRQPSHIRVTLASARLSQPVTITLPVGVETATEPSPRMAHRLSWVVQGPCSSCTRIRADAFSSAKDQETLTSKDVSVTSMGLGKWPISMSLNDATAWTASWPRVAQPRRRAAERGTIIKGRRESA
jgi:hypothetical protein